MSRAPASAALQWGRPRGHRSSEAPGCASGGAGGRRSRRGMSLMELIVAIALALVLMAVLVPAAAGYFQLQQRKAAMDLVMLYRQLQDEAVLRNATFRVVYDLEANKYRVEVSDVGAVIHSTPEHRERYEREMEQRLAAMSDEERAEWERKNRPFKQLQSHFKTEYELPSNVRIHGVYTPQYGRLFTKDDLDPRSPEPQVLYTYVFANGFSERAVIWLVDPESPYQGYTVEVEPLSGRILLHGDLEDWRDLEKNMPPTPPRIPS